jgi:hypothetical protein
MILSGASAVLRPAGNFLSGDKKSPKNTFRKSLFWRSCFGKRVELSAPHSERLRIPASLPESNSANGCCQRYFYFTALRRAEWAQCRSYLCNTLQSGTLRGIAAYRCSSSVTVFSKGVSLVTFFAQALRRRSGANSVAGRAAAKGRRPGVKKATRSSAGRVEAPFFQSAIAAP